MIEKNFSKIALFLSVLALALVMWIWLHQPKIAFVRTAELVHAYTGMQDAELLMKEKMQFWQSNIDSLTNEYRYSVNEFQMNRSAMSKNEIQARELELQRTEQKLRQHIAAVQEKSKDEEANTTKGILNQINAFVEKYSKDHNYDIIMGTTSSGNLLYANEKIDVTKEILAAMNKEYRRDPK